MERLEKLHLASNFIKDIEANREEINDSLTTLEDFIRQEVRELGYWFNYINGLQVSLNTVGKKVILYWGVLVEAESRYCYDEAVTKENILIDISNDFIDKIKNELEYCADDYDSIERTRISEAADLLSKYVSMYKELNTDRR